MLGCAIWMFAETAAGILRENGTRLIMNKRILALAIVTGGLLLVPLVAMRFTDEVKWKPFDFVAAGALLFGAGLAYEFVSRKSAGAPYRAGVGVAVAAGLLLVWVNLAVGVIGSEDNPANLMYVGVLAVGVVGAALARLEPRGMARTLFAMALAQALVPVMALLVRQTQGETAARLIGVNAFFALLFAGSAFLFRRAGAGLESKAKS